MWILIFLLTKLSNMFAELLTKGHFISSKLCPQEYLTQCWIAPATCQDPAPCLGEDGGVERKAFCLNSFAVDKLLLLHTLFTFFCPVQTTCHQHTRSSGQKYDYTITLHTAEWNMNTEVRSWTVPVHLTLHITRNLTRCQYSLYTQAESVSLYDTNSFQFLLNWQTRLMCLHKHGKATALEVAGV